ncbi:MAG: tetratricopeptide repeat protein [Bacteroidales bacterium]|jgi:PAS domain S-box-containing protein|nr:tetratricopeptide repeat protein [Bacteroidales bacterium]
MDGKADDLRKGLDLGVSDTVMIMAYNSFARDLMEKSQDNYADALQYLYQGIELAQGIGFKKGEAELLRSAGIILYYLKDFNKADDCFQKALGICMEMKNNSGIAQNYINMALIYHEQSKIYNSLNCLLNALSAWKQMDDSQGMIQTYKEIIKLYQGINNFTTAIEYTEEALQLAYDTGNKAEEASLYDILARTNISMGNIWDVAGYYDRSLQLYEELNDSLQIARITQNMAVNLHMNDPEKALELLQKSASIYEKLDAANATLYTIYNNMSSIYTLLSANRKAEHFKKKALEKAILSKQALSIAQAYLSIGKFYFEQSEWKKADEFFEKAYKQAVAAASRRIQSNALSELSMVKFRMGDYAQAMDYLQRYSVARDSLAKTDSEQSASQLDKQYEFERREKEKNEEIRLKIEQQNQSIVIQRYAKYGITIAGLITAVLLLFIFRWGNLNRKTNIQLKKHRNEIAAINRELQTSYDELSDYRDLLEEKVKVQTAKLQEREKQLTALSDHLPGGCIFRKMICPGKESRISYISSTAEKWLGVSPEEIKNDIRSFYRIIHKEDLEMKLRLEQESVRNMSDFYCEFRVNKRGQEVWLLETGTPSRSDDGSTIIWDGITVDISEQKAIETELIKARQQSEKSDMLKSSFLANMSHEIRTPMNGIVGFLKFLEQDHISADKRRFYIKVIRSNVQQLLQLIGDIIDISKIDTQQLALHPVLFDLNALMEELAVMFQDIACRNEKRVEVIMDNSGFVRSGKVRSDPVRVRQVIINLIANALKFTHKGYVRFGYELENKTTLHFFVEDTGIGIPSDKQKLIFDRFQQLHAGELSKNDYEGAGLGLAISRNLVEMLQGSIWVESETGNGSTFHFTLPYLTEKN